MSCTRALTVALVALYQLAWLSIVYAQQVPTGPQFQVNSYTTGGQTNPAVAMNSAGQFVVTWDSAGSDAPLPLKDTDGPSIQAQRYDSTGAALGSQFQVNTYTTNSQFNGAVALDAAGNFVVVWLSAGSSGSDTDELSIQAQRYDSTGAALGSQFQVNTYTTSLQTDAAVAVDGAGNFVVTWWSNGSAGSDSYGNSIQARRYDSTGAALGSQFQVNTYTTGQQVDAAVAVDGAGNFVVTWMSDASVADASSWSIQAQRYDSTGAVLGSQFQVNSYTTGGQTRPAVAMDSAGQFLVTWESIAGGTDIEIQAQRYDSTGAALGSQFQVNTYTTSQQFEPAVAVDGAGNFVISWSSDGSSGSDTSSYSIQTQRYDSTGAALGSQFQVNSYTTSLQTQAAVAVDGAGNFVVIWNSGGSAASDTSGPSVQAQRFTITLPGTPIPGRITLIKNGAMAKFVAKPAPDTTFPLPTADPVTEGGTLRFFDLALTAGDNTYALPSAAPPLGWKGLGNPPGSKGYKYKGAGTPTDPCKVVLVKEKVIKGLCKGSDVTLQPPFTGDVGIILSLGTTDRYCAQFGGDELKNDADGTKRKNAPAPGACP